MSNGSKIIDGLKDAVELARAQSEEKLAQWRKEYNERAAKEHKARIKKERSDQ